MDKIPEDVLAAADKASRHAEYDVWVQMDRPTNPAIAGMNADRLALVAAILAERERCAQIAEKFGAEPAPANDDMGTTVLHTVNGHDIAAAIRAPLSVIRVYGNDHP